jgi:hypothetical protein
MDMTGCNPMRSEVAFGAGKFIARARGGRFAVSGHH